MEVSDTRGEFVRRMNRRSGATENRTGLGEVADAAVALTAIWARIPRTDAQRTAFLEAVAWAAMGLE